MHAWLALAFFLAQPFWETKPPEQWTDHEIDLMLHLEPMDADARPGARGAGMVGDRATDRGRGRRSALAQTQSATPTRSGLSQFSWRDNREKVFVLAIGYPTLSGLGKEADAWKTVEKETAMRVGSKSYKVEGLFPPEPSDPVLTADLSAHGEAER